MEPSVLLGQALTLADDGDIESQWRSHWGRDLKIHVNLKVVSAALHEIHDCYVAMTVVALLADCVRYRTHERSVRKALRSLLSHPVPEVATIAAFSLARWSRPAPGTMDVFARCAESSERIPGSHRVLRSFFTYELALPLARSSPLLLWELLANDSRFGGMGQRHVPMRDPGKKFGFLAKNSLWQAREVGAAILCADQSVALMKKLPLLIDVEPRVRFRALEGILLASSKPDYDTIFKLLLENPHVKNESRLWNIQSLGGVPHLITIKLEDDNMNIPSFATSGFGRGDCFDVWESMDYYKMALTGFITLSKCEEGKDFKRKDREFKSRSKKVAPSWTKKYVR